LGEEILVPQTLVCFVVVENHRARQSTFRVEVMYLGAQFAIVLEGVEEVRFRLIRGNVRVDAVLLRT
jgi:hypothetical protein